MKNIFQQVDQSIYSNAMTYLRRPYSNQPDKSDADVVVLGLPFDLATTGRSGARMGPTAIRQASIHLAWEGKRYPWNFALTKKCNIVDAGDLVYTSGDSEEFTQHVETAATALLKKKKTILAFGGDHFVTLPLLRAHAKAHGKLALIHFDAHTDTYENGGRYDHGTMFYHAPKEGLVDAESSVQIGIRTEYKVKGHAYEVIDAAQANDQSVEDIVATIKKTIKDLPVYLTFDIDCLDPAYAPGTGTPVIGGMSTDKILKILRALVGINIVGMDVVEVSPAYDHSEMTALAAASIGMELLHLWTVKHRIGKTRA